MNGKLLVIDDEEKIRKVLRKQLSRVGYNVEEAKNGKETFSILKKQTFETIICDIKMPGFSGVEILEHVKKNYNTIPVIILTGFVETETAVEVMRKGAFDYLVKPVRKDEMIVTVEKAVRYKRMIEENIRLKEENRNYKEIFEKQISETAVVLDHGYNQPNDTIIEVVRVLSEALENKDPYKRGHVKQVCYYAKNIAGAFNFSRDDLKAIQYSALLHDCGKIRMRGAILDKKGELSEEEYSHIKKHPLIGEDIINKADFLKHISKPVRNHHERYDGQGYPDGLKEDCIPLFARIIAVADSFDALTNARPYRGALTTDQALSILEENRGSQFDPEVVDVFINNRIYC